MWKVPPGVFSPFTELTEAFLITGVHLPDFSLFPLQRLTAIIHERLLPSLEKSPHVSGIVKKRSRAEEKKGVAVPSLLTVSALQTTCSRPKPSWSFYLEPIKSTASPDYSSSCPGPGPSAVNQATLQQGKPTRLV